MHLYFDKIWKMSGWLGCSVTPQCLPWYGNCWNTSVNVHSEFYIVTDWDGVDQERSFSSTQTQLKFWAAHVDETNASGDGFMVKWAKERKVRLSSLRAVLQLSSMMVVVSCSGAVLLPVALVHAWKSELPLNSSTSAQINSWVVWHDWESQQEIYVKHTSKLLLQRIKQGNIRLFPKNIRQTMTEACWWLPKILVGCINSIYCFKVVYILLTSCGREKIQTKFKLEHTSNILLVIKDVLCTIIPEKSIIKSPKLPRLSCPWWVHANCWPQLYIE